MLECESYNTLAKIDKTLNFCIGSQRMIGDEDFRRALYVIDIGQNDLANGFKRNLSYAEVVKTIPSVLKEIEIAMKVR